MARPNVRKLDLSLERAVAGMEPGELKRRQSAPTDVAAMVAISLGVAILVALLWLALGHVGGVW